MAKRVGGGVNFSISLTLYVSFLKSLDLSSSKMKYLICVLLLTIVKKHYLHFIMKGDKNE